MSLGKRKLYRNRTEGKIAGVCAGIGDYFGYDAWLIRIAVLAIFFMGGGIVFPLYLVAWLVLDPRPDYLEGEAELLDEEQRFRRSYERPRAARGPGKSQPERASKVIATLDERFAEMEERLQQMEGFVTSGKYKLHRAFRDLKKD